MVLEVVAVELSVVEGVVDMLRFVVLDDEIKLDDGTEMVPVPVPVEMGEEKVTVVTVVEELCDKVTTIDELQDAVVVTVEVSVKVAVLVKI